MKKKIIICIFLMSLVLAGCAYELGTYEAAPTPQQAPLEVESGILQVGNMAYIPLNLDFNLDHNMGAVFNTVYAWEIEHPDREIVDIDYIWQQSASGSSSYTYGVIIRSIPIFVEE